jgi:FkbM family methyltransferase
VGVFAAWASQLAADVRVISVEPSPVTYKWLRKNVERNKLKVEAVEGACAAPGRSVVLYSRGEGAMNSLFEKDVAGSEFREIARPKSVTLQELFERFSVDRCDLLKLDCEGAEYEILYTAPDELLSRINAITMEYHVGMNEHDVSGMQRFLQARSFLVQVTPLIDPEGGYLYARRT